jgi:hypothetical protein
VEDFHAALAFEEARGRVVSLLRILLARAAELDRARAPRDPDSRRTTDARRASGYSPIGDRLTPVPFMMATLAPVGPSAGAFSFSAVLRPPLSFAVAYARGSVARSAVSARTIH